MKLVLTLSLFINFVLAGAVYIIIEDKRAVEKTFIKKIKNCNPAYLEK